MWDALATIGLVVMLVGLVTLVRPMPAIWVKTRRRAAAVFGCGFILLAVGASNDPATQERAAAARNEEAAAIPGDVAPADAPAPDPTAAATSAMSPTCGEVHGKTAEDLQNALAFCERGITKGVTEGAVAMSSILWLKVPREIADEMRADTLTTEQLVKTWMRGWKQHSGSEAVTVFVEWQDVEIAKGETTVFSGDQVTVR